MDEEMVIVPSAVVLPEPPDEDAGSPNRGTKRRASSASSSNSKRLRPSSIDGGISTSKVAPSRRGPIDADERKRGKRLFGGLLGTLSQNSPSSNQKRRTDIDRKQREKLRAQAEEEGELKKQRLEKLNAARGAERNIWNRQALKTRHENERDLARFLRTTTQPVLYYKPWILRAEEEQLIRQQLIKVERGIETDSTADLQEEEDSKQQDVDIKHDADAPSTNETGLPKVGDDRVKQNGKPSSKDSTSHGEEDTVNGNIVSDQQNASAAQDQAPVDAIKDNMDETGEDVVHGDEDAVLY